MLKRKLERRPTALPLPAFPVEQDDATGQQGQEASETKGRYCRDNSLDKVLWHCACFRLAALGADWDRHRKKDDKPFFATVVLVRVIGLLMVDACAAAFGFFRPNTMMQPNDTCKAEELLKGNKDIAEATAWTKFCGIARDFDCLLWVLLGIIIEKS